MRVQIETLLAGEQSIGHRPTGAIGCCSLQHWYKSIEEALLGAIVGNPRGTTLGFQPKHDMKEAKQKPSDEMVMACVGLGVESVQSDGMYTGRLLKKSTVQQVAAMLVDARRSYLEQTALQLLSEGFSLKPPSCLVNAESVVMLAAKSGNPTLARAVIAASPPTPQEVSQVYSIRCHCLLVCLLDLFSC